MEFKDYYLVLGVERSASADAIKKAFRRQARKVAFVPHALWRVDGPDLSLTLPVAPWEAALDAEIELPMPYGPVAMYVPAGSQTGRRLRLRGRGIPGRQPGDLYVQLELVLPPALDDKARDAYRAMARDLAFEPRPHFGADT